MDFSCQCSEVVRTLSEHVNINQKISNCGHNRFNCNFMDGDIDRDGKTPFKRLRTDLATKPKDSDHENELTPIQYSEWVNLPYVALVEIYRYLSNKDRFSLSLTCKTWSQPFSHPDLWRHVKFRFDGIQDWRAPLFVGPLAMVLRHLEIDCESTDDEISRPSHGSLTCLYDFLDGMIKCGKCNLVTLKLVNMERLSRLFKRNTDRNILHVLGDFLSNQTNLEKLDLCNAGFNENQGIYLLSWIAPTLGAKISSLGIKDFFYSIKVSPEITTCLEAFSNLKDLSINYENLSDDLLNALAASGSLKCIKVFANGNLDFSYSISQSWEELKKSCPSLEAHYFINKELGSLETLMSILTPGIPLVSLDFSLVPPYSDWPDVCTYIADNFKNRLRILTTEICEYTVSKDPIINAINAFIGSCQFLEKFYITDTISLVPDQHFIVNSIRERKARKFRPPCSSLLKVSFTLGQPISQDTLGSTQASSDRDKPTKLHYRRLSI